MDELSVRRKTVCELCVEPADLSVESRLASHLYRMVQESLTNIERHADATKAVVSLRLDPTGKLTVEISDNGKGISSEMKRKAKSFGLIGMRERVALLGGEFVIRSELGAGTSVEIVIPPARRQPAVEVLTKA